LSGDVLAALGAALAPAGVNLVGVARPSDYDARVPPERSLARLVPEARSVVVLGNGGGAFWRAYRAAVAREPGRAERADPLDAFTREVVTQAIDGLGDGLGVGGRIVFPFEFGTVPVSFMTLAACAGLGTPSLLGVLIHPEWGPWMALRAAWFPPLLLEAPRPADGFDPCPSCVERPCIAACPAGAVSGFGWDVPRCVAHRLSTADDCGLGCHARLACVIGPEHRYPVEALAHHQGTARQRMTTRASDK
jgi:epoxyqueuosine reductase QueG